MSQYKFHLVDIEDSEEDFYQKLHIMLMNRLIRRQPDLRPYKEEIHFVTRAARSGYSYMILPVGVTPHDNHLYLNVEMSQTYPITGMAPGGLFKRKPYFDAYAIHDRYQYEPDFRPGTIGKIMGR